MLSDRLGLLIKDSQLYEEVNRIINENSHIRGRLEHGASMPQKEYINDIALKVLKILRKNSEKQFSSLLKAVEDDEVKREDLVLLLDTSSQDMENIAA